jgi:hypothetical protein
MTTRRDSGSPRPLLRTVLLLLALAPFPILPAEAATASKKYGMEPNRPMTLELSVSQVSADQVIFEFPSSVMRLETANKARVAVTNGAPGKVRVGLAIALFNEEGNLVAAGVGGNKGGTMAPGEKEEFSIFFYYVSEQIPSTKTFQITLEVR